MKFFSIKNVDGDVLFSSESHSIRDCVQGAISGMVDLSRVSFYSENLSHVDFTGVDLSNAVFKDCKLHATNFKDAKTDNISFSGCDSLGAIGFYSESYKSFLCADDDFVSYRTVSGIDGSSKSSIIGGVGEVKSVGKSVDYQAGFGCN